MSLLTEYTSSVYSRRAISFSVLVLALTVPPPIRGYAVLAHEAIIDITWKDNLVPLLRKRFPGTTPEELEKSHAYAYGGAIIQDMGYYPFGSHFFSDLTHYVRSGDFIVALLRDAQTLNGYAFALGALSHYAADNYGHPQATNISVPLLFPKLARKYGKKVTYADNPTAHLKVEFSFDVEQVAEGNYAPQAYHNFIGFEVDKPLLEEAFRDTYSLSMAGLFVSEDLALGTYRHTVSSLLPEMTKVAWELQKDKIRKAAPTVTRKTFIYNLSKAGYRKDWGATYERPGVGARFLTFLFQLVPKVGPFRALAFKPLTQVTERLFMQSFNTTLAQYRSLLALQSQGKLQLPNDNFDTGEPVRPSKYRLADAAYAELVGKLKDKPVTDELRANILAYYRDLSLPFETKRDPERWAKLVRALEALKATDRRAAAYLPKNRP